MVTRPGPGQKYCWYCRKPLGGALLAVYWYLHDSTRRIHMRCKPKAERLSMVGVEDRNVLHELTEAAS